VDAAVTDARPDGGQASIGRSVAGMGAAAALSRAFGGLRMVVIAAVLGTTYLGNAFQASNSVSNVLFELLAAGALSAVLVPTFVALFERGDQRRAEEVAGGVLGLALLFLAAVTLAGVLAAPAISSLLTSGVSDRAAAADQRELTTYLLRFFIPQVLLYAVGAVTTAVLHARGRFALTAMAPIGNTVVLVGTMIAFRAMAGPGPGLDLSDGERLTLALGGTLGVAAFVGVPALGLRASGFRLRIHPRQALEDPDVRQLLRLSGWAALQHAGAGILLAAALVSSGGVAGGVVAYQLAMVVFLAPYGILSQPIHTAVLPRLAADVAAGDAEGLHRSLRWSADAMAVATLPVAVALAALARPVMDVLAFGEAADGDGPALLAAALAGLAVGIPVYGAFFLLTRAAYALGDSRTPAIASLASAGVGAAVMLAATAADGVARLALIGGAHSLAYLVGAVWLGLRLRSRTGALLSTRQLAPAVLALATGGAAWLGYRSWSPDGRLLTTIALALLVAGAGAAYVLGLRALGAVPGSAPSLNRPVVSP
jgi:putative peptidoglycan lipid II flippase